MKRETIRLMLPAINSKFERYRTGGWVVGSCPFAPWKHHNGVDAHPSFAIKEGISERSRCKCLSCGYSGDLDDLLLDLSLQLKASPDPRYDVSVLAKLVSSELEDLEFDPNIPDYEALGAGMEHSLEPVDFPYPDEWLASFKSVLIFPEARDYLRGRGLTKALVDALDLRYDPISRRVCFPFYNRKGELMGVQGRAIDKDNPLRYYFYDYQQRKNMHVWLGENHIDMDKPVVAVEGPFDYAKVFMVYRNVVASFSAGVSAYKLRRLSDASELITFYDHGQGGDSARERIHKSLKMPITDIVPTSDELDAGAMTVETIRSILGQVVTLNDVQF